MDADAKRVKSAIRVLGKKHVAHLREAFGDKHAVYWFTWERSGLDNRSPLQAIEAGEVDRVRAVIDFSYTNLPELEEEEESIEEQDEEETAQLEEAETDED